MTIRDHTKKPKWKKHDLLPVVARIIEEIYVEVQRFVRHDEIAFRLSKDSQAQSLVHKKTLEREASNIVAWFSSYYKQYKDGRKSFLRWSWLFDQFKADKIEKRAAYEPIAMNGAAGPQSEATSVMIQEVEAERRSGFQSNLEIRRNVEMHAMRAAEIEFKKRGYDVKDDSARRPYDLFCTKPDQIKYIEVKGTQGDGLDLVLTAGEVTFIRENKASCILCVVHGITVRGEEASGGQLSVSDPFDLSGGILKPIGFTFRRGRSDQDG